MLRATPTAKTICGYVLPCTFLLRTHTYFSIMTQRRNVYPHTDIQGVILCKWKPDVDSLPAWRIWETNGYALGRVAVASEINIFHPGQQNTHPTCCFYFYFFFLPLPTFLRQIRQPHNICCWCIFFLLLLHLSRSRYDKRVRSPPSCWVLGDTERPSTLLLSLGSSGPQDQCPPGWQMALMKLDNSAYMHKRMLNIDSGDQRCGAYSTL